MDNLKRFIVLPIFLLTACAPPRPAMMPEQPSKIAKAGPKVGPNETLTEKQQVTGKAETVSSWEIRGALAAKNKSKGWSAAMNWAQNGPSSYQIRLMGPLGAGAVLINKKAARLPSKMVPKELHQPMRMSYYCNKQESGFQ